MLKLYVGLPRSGKTYKVVHDIVNQFVGSGFFSDSKSFFNSYSSRSGNDVKYKYLYTNIEGFKFSDVNDYFENHDIERKCINLDWDIFYHHIQNLHAKKKYHNESDDQLIQYLKEHNLYKVLFVDDEAYMHFTDSVRDPILLWFLGYHGHLGFDIWLITQNKKKINAKYYMDCETFIEAQPKSKSLSDSRLRYFYFASDSFKKEQKYSTETIKTDPRIFSLYKSGDIHKPKKIIYKYLIYLVLAILFTFVVSYFFINHFDKSSLPPDSNTNISTSNYKNLSHPDRLYKINCDHQKCWNADFKFNNYSYPLDTVYYIFQHGSYNIIGSNVVASLNTVGVDYDRYSYKIKSYFVYAFENDIRNDFPLMFVPYKIEKKSLLQNAAQNGESDFIDSVNPI